MIRKKYNEKYFETINTEDKAYFLGLIFSDGCIVNDPEKHRYKLNIKLHKKDIHILYSFIKSIDGEMDVWKNKKRDMCEVGVSGKKIIDDLEKNGVVTNKTFIIEYPSIDENLERHFLRGYFDGDGCIRLSEDKRDNSKRGDLRIVGGSVSMIEKINERMNYLFGTNKNKIYGPKNKKYCFIGWAGMSDIEKIYEGFYKGSNLYLERKKTIFDNIIKVVNNKQKYRKK